jgi:catechol 2,3-dioxygenase-like lactoylglutathione lyase family enzyme
MKPQPMIAVANVEASSAWYQRVLGLASGHGGPEYEQLLSGGEIVLQLHHWDAHEHPHLGNPASTPYGNGVVLWFHAQAIDEAFARAVGAGAAVLEELKVNPPSGCISKRRSWTSTVRRSCTPAPRLENTRTAL